MKSKPQDLIVCNHFKLVKKLGTGAFGQIYLAENKNNSCEKYAAKLEEVSSKFPQLHFQAKMYKYLCSTATVIGIPKIFAMTTEGQYNVMLMQLLGLSIQDIFVNNNKIMSLKSALMIGYQMMERIKFLHDRQIIHRDIKPDNFLMGTGKNSHVVYIVDFGLSKKYIKQSTTSSQLDKHIPYKEGKQLTGTARYASINTHMGIQQSRRDDIQSIGHVIMYLLRGILPWQNMNAKDTKTKYKLIMEKKIATPAEVLCKGFPPQLATFINYARKMQFQEEPDYNYLMGLIKSALKSKNYEIDYIYDWTKKQNKNDEQLSTKQSTNVKQIKQVKQIKDISKEHKLRSFQSQQLEKVRAKQQQKQKQKQKLKIVPFGQNRGTTQMSRPKGSIASTGVNKSKQNNLQDVLGQKMMGPKISTVKR